MLHHNIYIEYFPDNYKRIHHRRLNQHRIHRNKNHTNIITAIKLNKGRQRCCRPWAACRRLQQRLSFRSCKSHGGSGAYSVESGARARVLASADVLGPACIYSIYSGPLSDACGSLSQGRRRGSRTPGIPLPQLYTCI